MKYVLLLALLLFGKPALSQEKLKLFKSYPTVPCDLSVSKSGINYYKCVDPKTGKIGVALSDSTVIIPPEYKDVKLVSFSSYCIDNEAYFMAQNHLGTYELFKLDGSTKLLLPKFYSPEPFQTLAHLYQRKAPPFLYATRYNGEQNMHLLLDRKTGKTTNEYLRIESLGNAFIGYNETGIDLLDTNLHTLSSIDIKGKYTIYMLDSKRFEYGGDWFYNPDYDYPEYYNESLSVPSNSFITFDYDYRKYYDEPFMNRLFGCAVITYQEQPSKRQIRKGVYDLERKQLLHLASGKMSPAIYLEVHRITSKNEVYYWALKDTSGRKQVFDIYNDQLEYLRSTQITAPEKFHQFGSLSNYEDYEEYETYLIPGFPVFHLENPEGKLAVLHHNGTRLTDFIWNREVAYEGVKRDSTPVFLVYAEDTTPRYGILVDKNNLALFGNGYATASSLGDQKFYYYRMDKGKSRELKIISSHFEILLDSVELINDIDPGLLNTGKEPYHLYKNRENRIFIFTGREISPLVPPFFRNPATRNRISKPGAPNVLFVDENGYLVSD